MQGDKEETFMRPLGGVKTGSQGRTGLAGKQQDPETWRIVEQTGQAVRQLPDPVTPHSPIDKLGGMAEERNRPRNPALQLREMKPQTSD